MIAAGLAGLVFASGASHGPTGSSSGSVKAVPQAAARAAYAKLPLRFEPNRGQADERVSYMARGAGYSLFLTPTEAVLSLRRPTEGKPGTKAHGPSSTEARPAARDVVRMGLINASRRPTVEGQRKLPGYSNYLQGKDPKKWQTGIPGYGRVRYAGVYPGTDLVFYGRNDGTLEYDFALAPGASVKRIGLSFKGAKKVSLDRRGDLVISTAGGAIRQQRPFIYQRVGDRKQAVSGRYVLKGKDRVGFSVGAFDRTRPLVIDPTLAYSTYLGGPGFDYGLGIAVDASGNAYVTGSTNGPFTTTANAYKRDGSGVFVAKLSPSGGLVYSTFLGTGSGEGIAVDATGNAYVTGYGGIATTANAAQPIKNPGGYDAFVAKLNPSGSALVYATYLGGAVGDFGFGDDFGSGIAVDGSGSAYVTGHTTSRDFPTVNAVQARRGGASDAFVTKLNPAGSAFVYSTYLGGSDYDHGKRVAVDATGSAYLTGRTTSPNFPTVNPIQASLGGDSDAYIAKLNPAGSALAYSTYLGGSSTDFGEGVAVDATGSAYLTGRTTSPNFPTVNPIQAGFGGAVDGFVTKLNAAGSALVYSTYLGGSEADRGAGIALDSSGSAYLTGFTSSTNFPTANAVQPSIGNPGGVGGPTDGFVTKLNPAGSGFVYSTYLGGSSYDVGEGIAVDGSGSTYLTGSTSSTDFPTANAVQSSNGGADNPYVTGADAFITKLGSATNLSITKTDAPDPVEVGQPLTYTLTARNAGPDRAEAVTVRDALPAEVQFVSASAGCALAAGVVTCSLGELASGASAQRQITVRPTAANPSLSNTATVQSTTADPNPADNSDTEDTRVNAAPPTPRSANLSIAKTDAPDPVEVGEALTYTLTAQNAGPDPAVAVTVRDELPAGVDFVSASAGCARSGAVVTCDLGDLASGASAQREIVVRPTQGAFSLPNTATVQSSTADPESTNNSATATTEVRSANLVLSKADGPDPAPVGEPLTYTLSTFNAGPSSARDVILRDELPAGVEFVSASAGCTRSGNVVSCDLGELASAAVVQREIVVRPTQANPLLSNTATVRSSTADPESANNSATATTDVRSANLVLTKTDAPDPVAVGEPLTYTLRASNAGPSSARDVFLRDELPAGVEFVSASEGCELAGRAVRCSVGGLASGATVQREVVVRPTAANPSLANTASVQSTTADPDTASNIASATTEVRATLVPPPGGGPPPTGGPAVPVVGSVGDGPAGAQSPPGTTPPAGSRRCGDATRPRSSVSKRSLLSRKRIHLTGRTTDRECSPQGQIIRTQRRLERVEASVATRSGKQCRFLTSKGTLSSPRSCRRPFWLRARTVSFDPKKSKTAWKLSRALKVPRGRYNVIVRGVDRDGNVEIKKRRTNRATLRAR